MKIRQLPIWYNFGLNHPNKRPAMLKSYFLLAWRNLLKHKASAITNIGGLALGLTTSILVMLFLVDELRFDKFHRNIADLYLLMKNQQLADGVRTDRTAAGPIAATLQHDLPEVKYTARMANTGTIARIGDKKISIDGIYTDTAFFDMMTFPAVAGDPGLAMHDDNSIILTESAAKKLFGEGTPLNQTFIIDDTVPVRVAAIIRDVPTNSTIKFEYVRPFNTFERQNTWLKKWDDNRILTWIQLKPNTNIQAFNNKATKILQTRGNDTTVSTFAMPMASLRLHSGFNNGKQSGGKIYLVMLIALLGFFVLIIACINFMNIATARSEIRAREVGVRKVMGATRKQIMLQFFCEALTITFFSLLVGIFASSALTPVFNRFMNTHIRFSLQDWRIWASIIGIGLLTGLISGSYPALFLSRFLPVKVLKGETGGTRRTFFRRALVTTQFWLASMFIIASIVVWQEINYIENRPLGYDQENLVDVHATADLSAKFPVFADQVNKMPGVKSISAADGDLLHYGGAVTGMDWPGKIPGHEVSIVVTSVGYHWIKTAGLKLAEGRDFDPAFGTDTAACLINETTVKRLGLHEPVLGQKLGGSTIIGVVHDFVYNNPSGIIAPMAIYLYKGAPNGDGHFLVRIANDAHWRQTIASIGAIVKTLDPRHEFEYSFTKTDYQQRFVELNGYGTLATIFGSMAIFISCLGLIGLAAFVAERRSKELSIRKVFGATVRQLLLLLSMDFLRPVIIAFVLAIPVAWWAMQLWLNNLAYRISLSWTVFAAGGVITLLIAVATVGLQGFRTATENPAKKLRNE
jgi:putative ABC transport system permease protein